MKYGIWSAAAAAALMLAGCTVTWENRQAAQEVAQASQPAGSLYLGWRVYQDKCARCHGADAAGTTNAPNLLPRVRELSERRFVGLVLQRYDLNQPQVQAGSGRSPAEAQVEVIMQRQEAPLSMPAWQDEPRVNVHILDLYAYLSARADGRQGSGRPLP